MAGLRQPGGNRELITTTADLTLTNNDVGKIICNLGASGAVNITLPAPTTCSPGDSIMVLSCADQNLTVTSGTADTLITLHDVAADSVAFSTASEKIGGGWTFVCVGSKWHCSPHITEAQTQTVAT
jgi:hypothetical protein